jgi:hypothetical protein
VNEAQVLEAARGKLEEGFTINVFARNVVGVIGKPVSPTDPSAVKWCARGAIRAVLGLSDISGAEREDQPPYLALLNKSIPDSYPCNWGIAAYNNEEGKEKTIAVFTEAIKLAKEGVPA